MNLFSILVNYISHFTISRYQFILHMFFIYFLVFIKGENVHTLCNQVQLCAHANQVMSTNFLSYGEHTSSKPNTQTNTSMPHQLYTIYPNLTQTQTQIRGAQKCIAERERGRGRKREKGLGLASAFETQTPRKATRCRARGP